MQDQHTGKDCRVVDCWCFRFKKVSHHTLLCWGKEGRKFSHPTKLYHAYCTDRRLYPEKEFFTFRPKRELFYECLVYHFKFVSLSSIFTILSRASLVIYQ